MFWKRKNTGDTTTAAKETPQQDMKRKSPKESVAQQLKQLQGAECLYYRLSASYGGGDRVAVVEIAEIKADNERKYRLSVDKLVRDKPVGGKICIMKPSDSGDIVDWICKYKGQLLSPEN